MIRKPLSLLSSCVVLAVIFSGCERQATPPAGPQAPSIPVSKPVQRKVSDYVDYTGRIDAVESLDVRGRVTGYLTKLPFKEGSEVKQGDLLFEIDPRPYQAIYDAGKAQVSLQEANYKYYKAYYARSRKISDSGPGVISEQELELNRAQQEQAYANLEVAKANLNSAKLNLDFTEVRSPIDGQVSRYYLTLGNLVVQDQTLLTTVVSLDPLYLYFEMDEQTVIRIRKAINDGKITPVKNTNELPIFMALSGEEGYPHEGKLDFVNNTVNPSTGTLTVRGVFANPLPSNGRRILTPGMFARVRLPIGKPHPSLLVIDRALGSDQGLKFVYVVDADNKVQYRRVETGPLQSDGLRVIEKGLNPDDQVVIGGLQQVRPRMEVKPVPTPMPSFAPGKAPRQSERTPATAAARRKESGVRNQESGVK